MHTQGGLPMKKYIYIIVFSILVFVCVGYDIAATTTNKEFDFLELEYTKNGQMVRERVSTGIIGKTLQVLADRDTSVTMWFYCSEFGGNY